MAESLHAHAFAHPNIALVKYWGKRADTANEPAVASLSITLSSLITDTRVSFDPLLTEDELVLNGSPAPSKLARISQAIDMMRSKARVSLRCRVVSNNNFPTAAGLASSASGFAALVCACNQALAMGLSPRQQSMLARAMSGSAARSLFPGFSKIVLDGSGEDATEYGHAYAVPLADEEHWPLEVCVAVVSDKEKTFGSTEGMERSRVTSPYYDAWVANNDADIDVAEQAVEQKDFQKLAEISEFSCLKMHALALASNPGLIYWAGATVDCMHLVRAMRASGTPVFFTADAGPQLKAICAPGYGDAVAQQLSAVPGVQNVLRCGLGKGAGLY